MVKFQFTAWVSMLTLSIDVVNAKIIPGVEFGLLTINPGTPANLLGLSVSSDGRLVYVSQSRDPFVGIFTPDGRIAVPAHPNSYLTVGGINTTSLEVHKGYNISTKFDVNEEGHLVYKNSSAFEAVNEGVGSPGGSYYRYYVYDSSVDYSYGRDNYTINLRVLWNQNQISKGVGINVATATGTDDAEPSGNEGFQNDTLSNSTIYISSNISTNGTLKPFAISGAGNIVDTSMTALIFFAATLTVASFL